MKILLIQPKMNMRPMDTLLKTQMAPSLALLTLVQLTPQTHSVKILNENIESINFEEPADLVAITVTVDVMNRAVEIARRFQCRGIPVVAGGIHVTAVPDACAPHFEAICIGMAERVWRQILADCEAHCLRQVYEDMQGISGREIVSPAYGAIDPKRYLYTNIISTSRGCPHKCAFCYNSCEHAVVKYVNRPADDVMADIRSLKTRHIMFIDDNFIGNPAWTKELLLKMKPLRLKWNAAVTTRIANHPDLLDLMKETGCQSLFVGFETLNAQSLGGINKPQNHIDQYETVISEIHKRGIMINASMVFGLDGDDTDIFSATLHWLVSNKIETITAHILTPYPGTALYQTMLQERRIRDTDLSHYNTAHVVFSHAHLTPEELYNGYLRIYKDFYSLKNILRRLPRSAHQWLPYLLFNLSYRKFGRLTEMATKVIPIHYIGKLATLISYRA